MAFFIYCPGKRIAPLLNVFKQKSTYKFIRKCLIVKSLLQASNPRPTDYKSVALPAELRRPSKANAKVRVNLYDQKK